MNIKMNPLGEFVSFFNGKAPDKNDEGVFFIYGSNGCIGHSKSYNFENAIILGRVGAYCGSVKISQDKFWASDNTIIVKPKEGYDLRYLYYRLLSSSLRSYAGGAAQPLITHTILRNIKIPVFLDKSIQIRIGQILSTYDNLIENNQQRIELLEQAARLLYREWFVHLRFPGHEHVRIVDGVPEGWERKTLEGVAPLNYGKALKKDNRLPGPFSVYGSSGVVGTHVKAFVSGPAIIIGRKGNVGSVYWSSDDFHPIDTVYYINAKCCSFHLYYALQHMSFINTDGAVPGLNRDFAHSRLILIPESKLYRLFEDTVTPMHQEIDLLQKESSLLAKARDFLLPRLMNGEVMV